MVLIFAVKQRAKSAALSVVGKSAREERKKLGTIAVGNEIKS